MSHEKFFKHFAYSMFEGGGDYPDTEHFNCPDCGAPVVFHGDDMNLPVGEEFWVCTSCGFRFMPDDFHPYRWYYDYLDCPECEGALNTHYQSGTGQPIKWECEDCGKMWIEDDDGDLIEE